ncbi:unnamed protein product [Acanthosepion pharaonis]|uniref:Uncharacterized protein n=1 Tax=Acanthosepion pharaonis TaxID=158019 RepID=A0A812DZY0_ACAPH|nr:unnamed protein product [Sepia pharaonis]
MELPDRQDAIRAVLAAGDQRLDDLGIDLFRLDQGEQRMLGAERIPEREGGAKVKPCARAPIVRARDGNRRCRSDAGREAGCDKAPWRPSGAWGGTLHRSRCLGSTRWSGRIASIAQLAVEIWRSRLPRRRRRSTFTSSGRSSFSENQAVPSVRGPVFGHRVATAPGA